MTMRVEVTTDDIARGRRHSADRCPLARAIRRATPVRPVSVYGGDFLGLMVGDACLSLGAPAQAFVNDFDAGLHVWPDTFYIQGPPDFSDPDL